MAASLAYTAAVRTSKRAAVAVAVLMALIVRRQGLSVIARQGHPVGATHIRGIVTIEPEVMASATETPHPAKSSSPLRPEQGPTPFFQLAANATRR